MPTTTIYARLNELYLLSSKINKVTYDSQSWDELLQGVCRGLTEQGHYKHVWIGKYQSDTNSIVAITQYGMVDELASEIFLNDPGLTGIQQLLFNTIRSKCVQSCDNLSSTELELCVRGSAVVAPLFQQNELYGVILFYDGSPEIFSNHDIILCEETARGLSGALNRFMNTTERKQSQLSFYEYFQAFMQYLPAVAFIKNSAGRYLFANKQFEQVVGLDQWQDKTVHDIHQQEISRMLIKEDAKVAAQGPLIFEQVIIDAQQNRRIFETIKFPIKLGNDLHIGGIGIDVTDRKRTEEALYRSENRYQSIIQASMDGYCIVAVDSKQILDTNEAYCRMIGYTREELLTMRMQDIEDEAFIAEITKHNIKNAYQRFETKHRHRDGSFVDVDVSVQYNPEGYLINFIRDITEHKKLEQKYRQAQKMEALGQLAGGVAHDFNNIVAAIMLNIDCLDDLSASSPTMLEHLTELRHGAERAARLTRQLVRFSRQSLIEKTVLNLNEVIISLLSMLARLIGENIELHFHREPTFPWVEADRGMMEQMLVNLCVNARDAMPNGGQLAIQLEFISGKDSRIQDATKDYQGNYVCLTVMDTGCGMDDNTKQRIFEPFFTTKGKLQGSGLGLPTVHGIVGQHDGWIEVESEIGQGTKFQVYLPATSKQAQQTPETTRIQINNGHANETLLIVEDDDDLRQVTADSLQLRGYRVLAAKNGPAALAIWEKNSNIDLLFTDIIMPGGMTGLELASLLRQQKPNLKVMITSGYNTERMELTIPENFLRIEKPYSSQNLTKAIRECLTR